MRAPVAALVLAHAIGIMAPGWSAHAAQAQSEPPPALFALIIGVNASPAQDQAPLHYADDDAARYLDLFRALGARTSILAELDANTRALHPQAAAEASPARRESLQRAVDSLAYDIGQARTRGVKSTLYVVYAGHGEARDGAWYLTLEDGALSETDLLVNVVGRAGADRSHIIIDACHADLLARPRGPGGTRRPLRGFVALEAASHAGHVGFLLSTSASGETHEWSGFEAGVFSHAVRSGLYGAADADGDRQVTYTEISAFVHRASEQITNSRFRPEVLARPPQGGDVLLDLRPRRETELRFDGPDRDAHYLLEDAQGIRILDFHGAPSAPLHLTRPVGQGPLYLRRVADGTERIVPRTDRPIQLEELPIMAARIERRGAAHEAFGRLFALGFDVAAVETFRRDQVEAIVRVQRAETESERAERQEGWRRLGGWTAVGVGSAAAIAAAVAEISAYRIRESSGPVETHRSAAELNREIDSRNVIALGLSIAAAGALTTGALLLFWPSKPPRAVEVDLSAVPSRAAIGVHWHF
jgi:hypothetical protein